MYVLLIFSVNRCASLNNKKVCPSQSLHAIVFHCIVSALCFVVYKVVVTHR